MFRTFLTVLLLVTVITSFFYFKPHLYFFRKQTVAPVVNNGYSFVVAGHVYGSPLSDDEDIYPPFVEALHQTKVPFDFVIFTGDMVQQSTVTAWERFDRFTSSLQTLVYLVPGNHDTANREIYESRYGASNYYYLRDNDLFMILDTTQHIELFAENELTMMQQDYAQLDEVRNMFIFMHHMVWWSPTTPYAGLPPNSEYEISADNYFLKHALPWLQSLPHDVYVIAGDVGATVESRGYMYDRQKNVALLTSGMGNGISDNFLHFFVKSEGTVTITLVPLSTWDLPECDMENPCLLQP